MLRWLQLFWIMALMWQPLWAPVVAARPDGVSVRYHPDGGLWVGDVVSIEVFLPDGTAAEGATLKAALIAPIQQDLGEVQFGRDALGRQVFTLLWAWDTRGLSAGRVQLQFSIQPGELNWVETVRLDEPPAGPAAIWLERDTDCCRLHYFSGTAAARDVDYLAQMVDERAQTAANRLGYTPDSSKKLDVNLVPRMLGQGGFTSDEVIVSYSDDNYTRADVGMLIQHELTHRIDAEMGGGLRPLMWVEGIAVYLTGGHYKPEPVVLRAAALVREGGYIPLPVLLEDFYGHQHETGYLEAAALVGYMSSHWGWEAFHRFYRDIHPSQGQTDAQAVDSALEQHFQLDLRRLDGQFLQWLVGLPVLPDLRADLRLTIAFYDALRAYQRADDPSADFRQVWLPSPSEMRKRGIAGDLMRGPSSARSQKITGLLNQAGLEIQTGLFVEAGIAISQARQMLSGP